MTARVDLAREVVAEALLATPLDGQVPTMSKLAARARTGAGTVQAALRSLENSGLAKTTAHGKYGRKLVSISVGGTWAATGRGSLSGVLPLPQSREFAGLASGLTDCSESAQLDLQLLFRQGATERLRALRAGRVDFLISSTAFASQHPDLDSVEFPEHTYYQDNAVVVITAAGSTPNPRGRIAIDRTSFDHTTLTKNEFPHGDFIDSHYLFIPDMIASGAVDAAVWHQTSLSPLLQSVGLSVHPLTRPHHSSQRDIDRAAIAWRRDDAAVSRIVRTIFDRDRIATVQADVIRGVRTPTF